MRYMEKGDSYVNKKFVSITNITYKGDAEILTSIMVHFIGFYAKGFLDATLNSKGYTNVSDISRLESYLENVEVVEDAAYDKTYIVNIREIEEKEKEEV